MKSKLYILILACLSLVACDRHDNMDDKVFVGQMAPHVYWDVASTAVNAGSDVAFTAQYYTSGEVPIKNLEVWYNVVETESKNVSVPWLKSFNFTISSSVSVERRISQKIQSYNHNEANWNDSLSAYYMESTFPTSNTLSKISYTNDDFDSIWVAKYYGDDFMSNFKDSLKSLLTADVDASYVDFEELCKNMNQSKMFLQYKDSAYNDDRGEYDYFFVNHTLPAPIDSLYDSMGFAELIQNTNKHMISYSKQYSIDANLHCVNENGVVGTALLKTIVFN